MSAVTCHTDGCFNADIAIELDLTPEVSAVVCGECGQAITDIDPPLSEPAP